MPLKKSLFAERLLLDSDAHGTGSTGDHGHGSLDAGGVQVGHIVMYVLDARAPLSSINPTIKEIVKNKTILYIINKCDLISKSDEDKIVHYFKKNNENVLALEGTKTTSKRTRRTPLRAF